MKTRRLVPAADCLILSQVCEKQNKCESCCHGMRNHVRMCVVSCKGSHRGDGVEGRVGADAEVRSGDVVGDGGGDDHNGNARLLVFLS